MAQPYSQGVRCLLQLRHSIQKLILKQKPIKPIPSEIRRLVKVALKEDVGAGDLTAALIDVDVQARARLICREEAILCGVEWANEVFRQVDKKIVVQWNGVDGDALSPNQTVFEAFGNARSMLTAERAAINLLQTLSGTASVCHRYARELEGLHTKVLDTRKTIPGLRLEQKYAAKVGGAENHRVGLFDGVLIKENHIRSAGSIGNAIKRAIASTPEGVMLEVEVENIDGMHEAIKAGAKRILLDNFTNEQLAKAVVENEKRAVLEASGNVTLGTIRAIGETGIDYISVGALTKHLTAVDFSLQFETL